MGHICEESPLRLIRFLQFSLYPHFLRDIFVHNIRISLIPCHAVKNNTFIPVRLAVLRQAIVKGWQRLFVRHPGQVIRREMFCHPASVIFFHLPAEFLETFHVTSAFKFVDISRLFPINFLTAFHRIQIHDDLEAIFSYRNF